MDMKYINIILIIVFVLLLLRFAYLQQAAIRYILTGEAPKYDPVQKPIRAGGGGRAA